jgi:membrane peptidoglycan carboxypeptidase
LSTQLEGRFPWGVLLISDRESTEEIPEWSNPSEQVTAARTAAVVRVLHGSEGPVEVSVGELTSATSVLAFDGQIAPPSGVVRVGDATGEINIELSVGPAIHRMLVRLDRASEAERVEIAFPA